MRALSLMLLLLLSGRAAAIDNETPRARALYTDGQRAYEAHQYQQAYDAFREAYLLSHAPALLYNMAAALEGLRRPHDAAENLRAYLRTRPDDPSRAQIEERIRALEESQRLIIPPPAPPAPPSVVADTRTHWSRRKTVTVVVGTVVPVVVLTSLGLGLGLGLAPHEHPTRSTLDTQVATP